MAAMADLVVHIVMGAVLIAIVVLDGSVTALCST